MNNPTRNLAANQAATDASAAIGDGRDLATLAESNTGTLTPVEVTTLAEHEDTIDRARRSFAEAGLSLGVIRDQRLYRQSHDTFVDYCRERWEITDQHARNLIKAAAVVNAIKPNNCLVLPATESQARPLTMIPTEEISGCWEEVVEKADIDGAGNRVITAKHVRDTVKLWKSVGEKYVPPGKEEEEDDDDGPQPAPRGALASDDDDAPTPPLTAPAKLAKSITEARNGAKTQETTKPSPKRLSVAERFGAFLTSIVGASEMIRRQHGTVDEMLKDKSWTPGEKLSTLGLVRALATFLDEFEEELAKQVEGKPSDEKAAQAKSSGRKKKRTSPALVQDILQDVDSLVGQLEKSGRTSDFQVERAVEWLKKARVRISKGCDFLVQERGPAITSHDTAVGGITENIVNG